MFADTVTGLHSVRAGSAGDREQKMGSGSLQRVKRTLDEWLEIDSKGGQ
jgi:hypothetical protein